jgi:stage V sporulation protein G
MKITDVKVFPVDEDKLKAYATITFENCFIVRDLKVISGNKGYFIAMPSKKRKDGTFRDVAHPLNSETRKMIEDAVLEVYERENVTDSAPAPSYHEGDASEGDSVDAESDAMDLESDAPEEDSVDAESDAVDLESDAPEEDSVDAESDAMDLEDDASEGDSSEGESIDDESDTTLFEGDAEADSVDTDGDEITETTAAEATEEEGTVEDSSPVESDQPEESEKGAEENPVIEGSDDPEKAFGYEE